MTYIYRFMLYMDFSKNNSILIYTCYSHKIKKVLSHKHLYTEKRYCRYTIEFKNREKQVNHLILFMDSCQLLSYMWYLNSLNNTFY